MMFENIKVKEPSYMARSVDHMGVFFIKYPKLLFQLRTTVRL